MASISAKRIALVSASYSGPILYKAIFSCLEECILESTTDEEAQTLATSDAANAFLTWLDMQPVEFALHFGASPPTILALTTMTEELDRLQGITVALSNVLVDLIHQHEHVEIAIFVHLHNRSVEATQDLVARVAIVGIRSAARRGQHILDRVKEETGCVLRDLWRTPTVLPLLYSEYHGGHIDLNQAIETDRVMFQYLRGYDESDGDVPFHCKADADSDAQHAIQEREWRARVVAHVEMSLACHESEMLVEPDDPDDYGMEMEEIFIERYERVRPKVYNYLQRSLEVCARPEYQPIPIVRYPLGWLDLTTNPSARVKAGTYRFTADALTTLLERHVVEMTHWDSQVISCKHGAPDMMIALTLPPEQETDGLLRKRWFSRQIVHCHRILTRLACMTEDVEALDFATRNAKERHSHILQYEEYISMAMHWFLDTIKRYKDMISEYPWDSLL